MDIVTLKDVQLLPLIAEVTNQGPQLEGLQILVSGSFKDGDVDVKVGEDQITGRFCWLIVLLSC
jgi:hypothetical protein